MSTTTAYLAGIATVATVAYIGFGCYLAIDSVRHSRPSQLRHNAPPDKLTYHDWFYWPAITLAPLLWPLVWVLFHTAHAWARHRYNALSPEQRRAQWQRYRG